MTIRRLDQPLPESNSNRLATTSLILGIAGWSVYLLQWCFDLTLGLVLAAATLGSSAVCGTVLDALPFLLWLGGVVSGHAALRRIRQTGERGRGRAVWGLALNYAGLVVTILFIILIIVLIVSGVQAGWLEKLLPVFHR
jgi:hypothetical protein